MPDEHDGVGFWALVVLVGLRGNVPKEPLWLTNLRDELGVLSDRHEQLRAEMEAVDRRRERIATAVSVYEEVIVGSAQPGAADDVDVVEHVDERDLPLTDRVRAAISSGLNTRRRLLEHFASRGVSRSKVDSAMSGMRKRGAIERAPGRRWVVRSTAVETPSVGGSTVAEAPLVGGSTVAAVAEGVGVDAAEQPAPDESAAVEN